MIKNPHMSPMQEKQRSTFFSIFYLSINAGSLLSTLITPILKGCTPLSQQLDFFSIKDVSCVGITN